MVSKAAGHDMEVPKKRREPQTVIQLHSDLPTWKWKQKKHNKLYRCVMVCVCVRVARKTVLPRLPSASMRDRHVSHCEELLLIS